MLRMQIAERERRKKNEKLKNWPVDLVGVRVPEDRFSYGVSICFSYLSFPFCPINHAPVVTFFPSGERSAKIPASFQTTWWRGPPPQQKLCCHVWRACHPVFFMSTLFLSLVLWVFLKRVFDDGVDAWLKVLSTLSYGVFCIVLKLEEKPMVSSKNEYTPSQRNFVWLSI